METVLVTSFFFLLCLFEMMPQQVHKNDDVHHKLKGPYGGNAVVHVQEAPNSRSDCPQQRMDGKTESQHRACAQEPR